MIDSRFAILAAAIAVFGDLFYLRDTLRGRAQPNRVSWFLWAAIPMIAFTASAVRGYASTNLITFAAGFGPALVLLASFVDKRAFWHISRFDWTCGALSLLAVILWQVTGNPTMAIVLSIAADALAAMPTIVKGWFNPQSESVAAYALTGIGAVIALLTVEHWAFDEVAFPLYLVLICTALTLSIKWPAHQGRQHA